MSQAPARDDALFKKANHFCLLALLLLSGAMLIYAVGGFLISPTSIPGIASFIVGSLVAIAAIVCFFLYARYQKASEKHPTS